MELYRRVSEEISRVVTERYSTSFSLATKQLEPAMRQHIYNIYGLVRLADEIVDGYKGEDASELLIQLQIDVTASIKRGFSVNPVVYAFSATARECGIDSKIIDPFFESMRLDLKPQHFNEQLYRRYIYGSAEVVGLMCLKVFCQGDKAQYRQLEPGAKALGAAFQKVNFLRDLKDDHEELGRYYFPIGSFKEFDDEIKGAIVQDIENDFKLADGPIKGLPKGPQLGVELATSYYRELLRRLKQAPAKEIKQRRFRLNRAEKLNILVATTIRRSIRRQA